MTKTNQELLALNYEQVKALSIEDFMQWNEAKEKQLKAEKEAEAERKKADKKAKEEKAEAEKKLKQLMEEREKQTEDLLINHPDTKLAVNVRYTNKELKEGTVYRTIENKSLNQICSDFYQQKKSNLLSFVSDSQNVKFAKVYELLETIAAAEKKAIEAEEKKAAEAAAAAK